MPVLNSLFKFLIVAILVWIPQPSAAQDEAFPPPGGNTVGLVWDEARARWWASDREENGVLFLADGERTWTPYLTGIDPQFGQVAPGPIAMSGTILWLVIEGEDTAFIVSIQTSGIHPMEVGRRIEIPPAARRRPPSITGLTWDGDDLWLITACGLCSTLFKIDSTTGNEILSLFPACNARGIAFKKNGLAYKGELWTIAYNGPLKPSHLTRRRITRSSSTISSDQEYFDFGDGDDRPIDPTAIAVRGYLFWIVDRDANEIKPYQARDLP